VKHSRSFAGNQENSRFARSDRVAIIIYFAASSLLIFLSLAVLETIREKATEAPLWDCCRRRRARPHIRPELYVRLHPGAWGQGNEAAQFYRPARRRSVMAARCACRTVLPVGDQNSVLCGQELERLLAPKGFDTSGKSAAYRQHRKNQARAGNRSRAF